MWSALSFTPLLTAALLTVTSFLPDTATSAAAPLPIVRLVASSTQPLPSLTASTTDISYIIVLPVFLMATLYVLAPTTFSLTVSNVKPLVALPSLMSFAYSSRFASFSGSFSLASILLSIVALYVGSSTTKVSLSVRGSILSPSRVNILVWLPTGSFAGVNVQVVPAALDAKVFSAVLSSVKFVLLSFAFALSRALSPPVTITSSA